MTDLDEVVVDMVVMICLGTTWLTLVKQSSHDFDTDPHNRH
jgi:hypothetical protein